MLKNEKYYTSKVGTKFYPSEMDLIKEFTKSRIDKDTIGIKSVYLHISGKRLDPKKWVFEKENIPFSKDILNLDTLEFGEILCGMLKNSKCVGKSKKIRYFNEDCMGDSIVSYKSLGEKLGRGIVISGERENGELTGITGCC